MQIPNLKNVTIEVTQEYITKGKQGFPNKCPIALAIRPHVKKGKKTKYNVIMEHIIYDMGLDAE